MAVSVVVTATALGIGVSGRGRPAGALGGPAGTLAGVPGVQRIGPQPAVALTFDDGPDPETTPRVLDVLAAHHAKATFFLVGSAAERYPDLVRRIVAEGHTIGGHTWSHARLRNMSEARFAAEVDRTDDLLRSLTGSAVRCVRPPFGVYDGTVLRRLAARGLAPALWAVDPRDWAEPGPAEIVARVDAGLAPDAIVLLHDFRGASQTPDALGPILDAVEAHGLQTVSVCGTEPAAVHPVLSAFGAAAPFEGAAIVSGAPITGGAARRSATRGAWLTAADGGVFAFGDAPFLGSLAGTALRAPVVSMAATPRGRGYWLASADGGVFAFGDASFAGSLVDVALRAPVVSVAATPTGRGYWLASADGGVFAFGDASFAGSLVDVPLRAPVVSVAATPTGRGYWLASGDGGVFAFGDAPYLGSATPTHLAGAFVPARHGYWLVSQS